MKKYLFISIALLLLAAACNKSQVQPASPDASQGKPVQNQPAAQQQTNPQAGYTLPPPPISFPPIQGVLKISDDLTKGNLMLIKTDATSGTAKNITIYLQTQRDFTPWLNKKVNAYVEGTPDRFILVDVQEIQ